MRLVLQILETITRKKQNKNKKTFQSASTTNHTDIYWGFFSKKKSIGSSYQLWLEAYYILLHPKIKIKHHTSCNWKLIVSYSILS